MPIYRYKCSDCGKISERITSKPDDVTDVECESCGGTSQRIPSICRTYMAAHGDIKGAPRRPGFDNVRGRRHPANIREEKPGLV
tara:strand:+ start:4343 stop:4594 length:252 start_codon:yes stop_codon:yes gene_type:complete